MTLPEPLTVAGAERVMVPLELLIDWIVVPAGMSLSGSLTSSPTTSPFVLLMPVTVLDPFVSVPPKLTVGPA